MAPPTSSIGVARAPASYAAPTRVDDASSGTRSPLTQRFLDDATEAAFQTELGAASLDRTRRGFLQAIILWGMAAAILPFATADVAALEALVASAILVNLVAWAVFRRGTPVLDRQQTVVGVAHGVASACAVGLLALGDASFFERFGAAGIMVNIVFAQLVVRLRFVAAVLTSMPCMLGYTLLAWVRLDHGSFATNAFLAWATFWIVAGSSYALEATTREVFHQRRIITEQGAALEREKEKSDRLLLNVLPRSIAARLRERHAALAESFDSATVLFADIVGFTKIAGRVPAGELVAMLDDLFSRFDDLAERHGLEKIKTIGDAYMVVGGVPERCDDHAARVAAMGLDMLAAVDDFARSAKVPLALRVGIHSGEVVAGVIGKKKFAYDLWGDTVNTASRMESHGVAGRVHVTEATYELLRDRFAFSERGVVDVKGKGEMRTWFLDGNRARS